MTPVLDGWTIVIVGSWNIAILNPDWLGRNVLDRPQVEVELLVGPMRPQIKVATPLVSIVSEATRVVLNARQTADESVSATENVAVRLLEKLPETPVTGVGVNFAFSEKSIPAELAELFQIRDTGKISDENLEIKATTISRRLSYDDRDLNLQMTQANELSFAFNYHKTVASAVAARDALQGKALKYKEHALKLMHNLFNLDPDE